MKSKKVIFTDVGLGTFRLTTNKALPKELLPIVDTAIKVLESEISNYVILTLSKKLPNAFTGVVEKP